MSGLQHQKFNQTSKARRIRVKTLNLHESFSELKAYCEAEKDEAAPQKSKSNIRSHLLN